MSKILGDASNLLKAHGKVNGFKILQAIEYVTDFEVLDIDEINSQAEKGGLYIEDNGHILESYKPSDEEIAKYKLVPTGLKINGTSTPIFASFIKNKDGWEGAFIGTGVKIFQGFCKHYNGGDFDYTYQDIFGNGNESTDINGFGLNEVTNSPEEEIIEHEDDVIKHTEELITSSKFRISKIEAGIRSGKLSKSQAIKEKRKLERSYKELESLQKKLEEQKNSIIKSDTSEHTGELKYDIASEEVEEVMSDDVVEPIEETEEAIEHSEEVAGTEEETAEEDYEPAEEETAEEETAEEDYELSTAYDGATLEYKMTIEEETEAECCIEDTDEKISIDISIEDGSKVHIDNPIMQHLFCDKHISHIEYISVEVYKRLMFKEKWFVGNRNRLLFYLKTLFNAIYNRKDKSRSISGNGYMMSSDRKCCLINTGLLDKYGNFIYLIDKMPNTKEFGKKYFNIMTSKSMLIGFGFEAKQTKNLPEPFKFCENPGDLVFRAELEDFDLEDELHLNHIIQERKFRFPDVYKNVDTSIISDKIKASIMRAINISKVDYKYVMPKYDLETQTIQFMIPLYLDTRYGETPELVIVVGKRGELWKMYTVLTMENALDDVRLLSNTECSWLK